MATPHPSVARGGRYEMNREEDMKLNPDIARIKEMKWQHYAGRNIPYLYSWAHIDGYRVLYPEFLTLRFRSIIIRGRQRTFIMLRDPTDTQRLRQAVAKKVHYRQYAISRFDRTKRAHAAYLHYGKKLSQLDMRGMDRTHLAYRFQEHVETFKRTAAAISTLIEIIHAYTLLLTERYALGEPVIAQMAVPDKHTTPVIEEVAFQKLLQQKAPQKNLRQHFEQYRWMPVYLDGQPWTWRSFQMRIRDARSGMPPGEVLRQLRDNHRQTERRIADLIERNHLRQSDISLLRAMMYYRMEFENAFGYVTYHSRELIRTVTKRLCISQNDLMNCQMEEAVAALTGDAALPHTAIRARRKLYVLVMGKRERHAFHGAQAKQLLRSLSYHETADDKQSDSGLCGTPAQPGNVTAKSRVITSASQLSTMRDGEILVTHNTTPTFVPAIKKAAAIVTDEGGITCHAAIVSRELGIPCVVGVAGATSQLKTGQQVEVDAQRGIVRKLQTDQAIQSRTRRLTTQANRAKSRTRRRRGARAMK